MSEKEFDPSGVAVHNGNFFGLPHALEDSELVILSVPWDVTTSYRDGTSRGPEAVLEASYQVDLFSPLLPDFWSKPIGTFPVPTEWKGWNHRLRTLAKNYIKFLETGGDPAENREMLNLLEEVNRSGAEFHKTIRQQVEALFRFGKRVILLGGDHSTSIALLEALDAQGEPFSILHFDAHADLRVDYEGFPHSHASIMYRALQLKNVERITQVGIRDVSDEEVQIIQTNPKMRTFFDWDLKADRFRGLSWRDQCENILGTLGKNVYISFDIDGLDPKFCPHTGTPVPGGLELSEVNYLLNRLTESGRRIIGADLVEVSPGPEGDEWDANVGARALFHMIVCFFKSWNNLAPKK